SIERLMEPGLEHRLRAHRWGDCNRGDADEDRRGERAEESIRPSILHSSSRVGDLDDSARSHTAAYRRAGGTTANPWKSPFRTNRPRVRIPQTLAVLQSPIAQRALAAP